MSFEENPPLDSHKQNTTHCMIRERNSMYDAPCNPFSLSTTNITHDDNGSKQVDPCLTLYKRSKFHSPKVSSDHSLFSFLVSWRENWLNRRKVLGRVTLVTFDSHFFLFRIHSHCRSPKYFNLLIFMFHQLASSVGTIGSFY